ncbi:MAG: TatD family hydrolase [Treponema sp.]
MYTDAHLHLADYFECRTDEGITDSLFAQPTIVCCSAHNRAEFERQQTITKRLAEQKIYPKPSRVLFSFGIHPQNPVRDEFDFLRQLLETKCIQAIGECGFDLFDAHYKRMLPAQQQVWEMQLALAQEFHIPLVIHCRKALPLIFESMQQLKKLPAVIFHGWGGSPQEAAAFLRKGVNAYFSLGKAVLRGQKTVCAMAMDFDIHRLLTETDAPYMKLKDEPYSHPQDIAAVALHCAALRKYGRAAIRSFASTTDVLSAAEQAYPALNEEDTLQFLNTIAGNFTRAFGLYLH